MNSPKPNNDRELEELVAYLDGELQPQRRGAVEKRLSKDDTYLKELQSLDNVWSALDELPQATVDASFSRDTIEMVAVAEERDLAKRTTWLPVCRRQQFFFAIVGILAATVGFAATRLLIPNPNALILNDLPIIEHLDVYAQFPSKNLLQKLHDESILPMAKTKKVAGGPFEEELNTGADRISQAHRRIEAMEVADRGQLLAKQSRYRTEFSEAQRQQMRELHQKLATADDADQLEETVAALQKWLDQRTPGEKAELRKSSPRQVLQQIREQVHTAKRSLSEQDAAALKKESESFFQENKSRIAELFSRGKTPGVERMIRQRPDALAAIFAVRMLDSGRGREELYGRMTAVLSDPLQQHLAQMPPPEAMRQLRQWIREAFSGEVTAGDLEDFFVTKFNNDEREDLLAMPWPEMEKQLFESYQKQMLSTPNGLSLPKEMDHYRGKRRDDRGPPLGPDQRIHRRRERGGEFGPPPGRRPGEPRRAPRGSGSQVPPRPPRSQENQR